MAMCELPLKLYKISRFFFVIIIIIQGFLLSKYVVDHQNSKHYYGCAGVFIFVSLFTWFGALCFNKLKNLLGIVWFFYMVALVVMIGWIYGGILIEHNKLREEIKTSGFCNDTCTNNTLNSDDDNSFFNSKSLKLTLCFTPGEMLLLLTSVEDQDGILEHLYLTTVMDLFDGIEMLEVLHEDVCNIISQSWEITVLGAASLYFLFSFLDLQQVKFTENAEHKGRKKTSVVKIVSQIILNLTFLIIRLVLWLHFDFDSAIFTAKNIIGLVIAVVPVLKHFTIITY